MILKYKAEQMNLKISTKFLNFENNEIECNN